MNMESTIEVSALVTRARHARAELNFIEDLQKPEIRNRMKNQIF
jgi:hypothetical protein